MNEYNRGVHPICPDSAQQSGGFETIREAIGRAQAERFVGRGFEQAYFRRMLRMPADGVKLLNLSGIGGVGKSALLGRYREIASQENALFLQIDMRDSLGSPVYWLTLLAAQLGRYGTGEPELEATALRLLNQEATACRVVLALDQYEHAGSLDAWLREHVFGSLHTGILIVISGRDPLGGAWTLSPFWRRWIVALPLHDLTYQETIAYLQGWEIVDRDLADQLWLQCSGHPLALSLLAALNQAPQGLRRPENSSDTLQELMRHWLAEVSDEDIRALVYAASVPHSFDQELLSAMTGGGVGALMFERLIGLSFVRRSAAGWQLHDLVRETVAGELRLRMPAAFAAYRLRAVAVLRQRISAARRAGRRPSREVAELLGQVGNPVLRAHFRHSRESGNYWEELRPDTQNEAEAYIARRLSSGGSGHVVCADPESGTSFRYQLSAEQMRLRVQLWQLSDVLAQQGSIRLLRHADGHLVGLAALVPVTPATMPYLRTAPLSSAFCRIMECIENGESSRAWFIMGMDIFDPSDLKLRSDLVHLLLEWMLEGALLVASPPPLPFFRESYVNLGFTPVAGAEHGAYGGDAASETYLLDTRGEGLIDWLERVTEDETGEQGSGNSNSNNRGGGAAPDPSLSMTQAAQPAKPDVTQTAGPWDKDGGGRSGGEGHLFPLTPRETEVAELLINGHTNSEIAAKLYMSESTVKKHIKTMLQKTGLKNRTQLAAALLNGNSQGNGRNA